MFLSRKRKGMEMAINTTVMLVVLLVLLLVLLLFVSRGSDKYTGVGVDKIEDGGDFTNCQVLCWRCCRGSDVSCDDGINPPRTCGCKVDQTGC